MSSLTFPVNLGSLIDQDGSFPHVRISTSQKGIELENMNLYLPSGLTLEDGASYEGVDMTKQNIAEQSASKSGLKLSDSDRILLGEKAISAFSDAFSNFTAGANLRAGIAINPNQEMAFTSMNIRSFSMSWDFVPESLKDAQAVRDITNFFRKYMYPKRQGLLALEYPPQFRIQFYVGEKESLFLPTIYDSYLTSLSVNYNPQEGSMVYLSDLQDYIGTKLSISTSFSEAKMLTRDDLYPEKSLKPIQNDDRPPFVTHSHVAAAPEESSEGSSTGGSA